MPVFEEYLYTFLVDHPTLAPVFGNRVTPLKILQKERRPSLTYQMTQRLGDQIIVGKTGKEDRLYTFTVWTQGYLEAKAHAELVQGVLDQAEQAMGPFRVVCFGKDQRDVYDDVAELFGVETDIQLLFMNYS